MGKRGAYFLEYVEKDMEIRYNKLSDKCNLLKNADRGDLNAEK